MRAKPMILIVVALACGLVASIGISQVMDRNAHNNETAETVSICVTAKEADIGKKLEVENLRMENWPKDRIPEGAITSLEDAKGQYPMQRLYPGEPILKAKLMDGPNGAIKHIPDGFTVVSVNVTMDTAVSGLIKPGDHVDVMVYLSKSGEIAQTLARTILRKVRIFAVNEQMNRESDKEDEKNPGSKARTVSLLVRPAQAEKLTLANELGKLRLALRRPDDSEGEDTPGASISDVLGVSGTTSDHPHAAGTSPSGGNDLMVFLKGAATNPAAPAATDPNAAASTAPAAAVPAEPEAQPPQWAMDVLTPDGPTRYQWRDTKALPTVLQPDGSERALTAAPSTSSAAAAKPADPAASGSADKPVAPQLDFSSLSKKGK